MKLSKIFLFALIVSTFLVITVSAEPEYFLIDSWSEGNATGGLTFNQLHPSANGTVSGRGQSFTMVGTNQRIGSAKFYLFRSGGATGTVRAGVYKHTGVFGVNGKPIGAALSYSDSVDILTLNNGFGNYGIITFNFTGANQVELNATTNYFITVERNALIFRGQVGEGVGPGDAGNGAAYSNSAWVNSGSDHIYYAYYVVNAPEILSVTSDTTISLNVPGWINTTIRDLDGVTDLTTVDMRVQTPGNAENFTLRWTQAGDAFTELSDPDNICTLNPESVRANINATTDLISFNFNITGGQSGLCDVRITAIDDVAATTTQLFADEFTFSYFNFNPTADLVDAAFEQFGIIGYLTTITTWISGLVSKFESSLTRILALVLLQFTVIEQVYTFFTGWATDLFATALTFSTFYHQIIDGTSPWIQPIYAIGNFWDLIGYDSWAPAVPMLLFIWWLNSMPKRASQTVGGEFQVFLNDINTAIGLISYFVSIFSYVANAIIDRVYGLFPAIT